MFDAFIERSKKCKSMERRRKENNIFCEKQKKIKWKIYMFNFEIKYIDRLQVSIDWLG